MSAWWCAGCGWNGPEEKTVMLPREDLPTWLKIVMTEDGEAKVSGETWRSCPACRGLVYQWLSPEETASV